MPPQTNGLVKRFSGRIDVLLQRHYFVRPARHAVAAIGDILLHDRGVDGNPLEALVIDCPGGASGFDGLGQQPLSTFLTNSIAPAPIAHAAE